MTAYEETLKDLVSKLKELFQMDQADLDFGIYRVMKAKHDEIDKFLTKDLLPTVKKTLEATGKSQNKQKELDEIISNLRNAGIDPDTSPKVQELKALLENGGSNSENDAKDIFSNLITFFSRYYSGGDFMSLRRYKKDTYSPLPMSESIIDKESTERLINCSPLSMNGEEVKLHWANADQYYIKSSENLTNYAFVDDPDSTNPLNVKFVLVAATTEQNNNKSQEGERVFTLASESPFEYLSDKHELSIKFEYQVDSKKRKQKDINANIVKHIEKLTDLSEFPQWPEIQSCLLSLRSTKANPKRTLIEKHLIDFTAKNKFDYFIHKDLGGFLNKELDYFIKSELVKLDDIIPSTPTELNDLGLLLEKQILTNESQLKKVIALKSIAQKIIQFLGQLENFQKKLWLKKKFVLETNWLLSLTYIAKNSHLFAMVTNNEKQLNEWVTLFDIDKQTLQNDILSLNPNDFLAKAEYEHLVIHTIFFTKRETFELLSEIDEIDTEITGEVVNSENLQAMNLLSNKHKDSFDFVYIDPPYNTGNDGFLYKDAYKHSSWLSLLNDRLDASRSIISPLGNYFLSIDDNENTRLKSLMDSNFGEDSFEAQIIVQSNKRGQTYQDIAKTHEYLLCYKVNELSVINELQKDISPNSLKDETGPYELWELRNRNPKFGRFNRPNLFYPIYIEANNTDEDGYAKVKLMRDHESDIEVVPLNSEGKESCWRWGVPKLEAALLEEKVDVVGKIKRDGNWNIYEKARKGTTKAKSIWLDTSFISEQGTVELGRFGFSQFGFPKPTALIKEILKIGSKPNSKVLDFFAGSGTTAQAVMDLNREDGGNRKFTLIEMGEYVQSIIIPRLTKSSYSSYWKNGKPQSNEALLNSILKEEKELKKSLKNLSGFDDKNDYLFEKQKIESKLNVLDKRIESLKNKVTDSKTQFDGSKVLIKTLELESYEDILSNIDLKPTNEQKDLLADVEVSRFNEQYTLQYMLDFESRNQIINSKLFESPFNAEINTVRNSQQTKRKVDLVETFNYILGLNVSTIRQSKGVYEVIGKTSRGDKCLILWRDVFETSNDQLDEWFKKQDYNSRDMEFDLIYVNGDNNLPNLKTGTDHWKVQLIETVFYKLMFDVNEL